ncbi:SDR family oxidoreductase [Sediminitomix flava]|uniref:Short-subunit dehydrogenase n=1 Tax=Sediminitomix flava TaxID=379075 RepID=A0A315ZHT7_SEDFL|nr:SDR family NAD(P)-dependent oxidoreductase [Sediminitomix flava]PWJ44783.1 short-subunit dehydrogenase [Sediminitomix flava]
MIVVTGGSKGIGKAIIEKFAQAGHNIASCARNAAQLSDMKKEIEEKYKVKVYIQTADLSVKEDTATFIDFVKRVGEPVKVLVNNTGVFIPGAIHEEEDGILEQMIETNLYSAYRLTKGFIREMMDRKEGHIFNIASVASFMAYANGGSYSISKHAMLGMSRSLREEMKPFNVKVTSIMPGATRTASWDGVDLPDDRFSKSEDIAELVFASYTLSQNSVVEDIVVRPQLGDI